MIYSKFCLPGALSLLLILMCCTPARKVAGPVAAPSAPGVHTKVPETPFQEASGNKDDAFFINLFKQYPGVMDSVLLNRKNWNVQVIYTEIHRNANQVPTFQHHYFNRSNARYFYPASTVKFPIALLALEKLNQLRTPGLNKFSTMITDATYSGQTPVYNDPNTAAGKPTIAQYIKKILLVSDNDAYNRLYEFLGQEHINEALHKKGYRTAEILHRLDIFLSEDENRHTNPVNFYDENNNLLYRKPLLFNKQKYAARNDRIGNAYYTGGKLVKGPMDFSKKNKLELADLHTMLMSLVFPQAVPASQRFDITEEDRKFLLQSMSQLPSESKYPAYDSSYQDAYIKFILYGAAQGKIPGNIRIFNKPGDAYGQLTDVAYVVDFEKKIEFLVSATIYCNADETLNDDKYDYESIGLPFMKNVGVILYEHESKRKRNVQPDLSSLIFTYNN